MNLTQTINDEYSSVEEITKENLQVEKRDISNIISAYQKFLFFIHSITIFKNNSPPSITRCFSITCFASSFFFLNSSIFIK